MQRIMKNNNRLIKIFAIVCIVLLVTYAIVILNKENNKPSKQDLDVIFHTNLELTDMYLGENEYRIFDHDVYCLKGVISNDINWQGHILVSKSKNIDVYSNISNNYEKTFSDEAIYEDIVIKIEVFEAHKSENANYYEPKFLLTFNTKYGYYGIYVFPNFEDSYSYSDKKVHENDLLTIKRILSEYILIEEK